MKNLINSHKRLIQAGQASLLAGLMLSMTGCSTASKEPATSAASPEAQLMFVQSAEDLEVDAATKTLRLVKVNPADVVLFGSASPNRRACQNGRLSHGMDRESRQGQF